MPESVKPNTTRRNDAAGEQEAMTAKDKAAILKLATADYQKTRKTNPTYPASSALMFAKTAAKAQVLWDKMNGWTVDDRHDDDPPDTYTRGPVRLQVLPDEDYRVEDNFDPSVYDDPEKALQAEKDEVERNGVWGVVGEYWDGENWQQADSCWGHVGYKDPSDPFENAYAADIMLATIAARHAVKHCPNCHRPKRAQVTA